jgi:hypothetical protein
VALSMLVRGGGTDPALACFSVSPFRAAAAALFVPSSSATASSTQIVDAIFGQIRKNPECWRVKLI